MNFMSDFHFDRRKIVTMTAGTSALVGLAACTQQQVDDAAAKVADIIQQIQAGVRAACSAVGVVVPTANTVLGIIAAIAGSANPAIITAAMVTQAIQQIAAVGCQQQPQGPSAKRAAAKIDVNGKSVPIEFY